MQGKSLYSLAVFMMSAALRSIASSSVDRPAVIWYSAPVGPGELVQIHGGAWGTNPVIEVTGITDGRTGRPQQASAPDFRKAQRVIPFNVTENGICFEYPRDLAAGLAAFRVISNAKEPSDTFILNEPAVWWIQGDLGREVSQGGWLRLFGRCLSRTGKTRVSLRNGSRHIELNVVRKDVWSLDTKLPSDIPVGVYTVYVHNGDGGQSGWRDGGTVDVRAYREVWKTDRFDVTAFGAIPNDGLDDTRAVQAALERSATNGGGIVYLPRGRFQCNDTLHIPPKTLLRGESREATQLYWPDCEEPPENLIEATSMFGIEDLFIHAGKYRNGIVCKNESAGLHELGGGITAEAAKPHDITLRRVRLKLIIDQYMLKNTNEYEKRAYLRGNGIVIRDARFVRVEDCDLYASKEGSSTLYFVLSADYLNINNCRINGSGWAVVGGDKIIFENNDAYNCTYSIAPVCRNLFWSHNRQHDLFTNNRESITHDGARTAFRGIYPAACDGTRLAFDFGAAKIDFRNGVDYWIGQNVQLVEGHGAGQTRTITALTNSLVTIDRPWSITPDATSRFVIAAERRHLIYADNETEDASIAIQLYGGLTEGILARNRSSRAGGFRGFGMDYHAIIPLWYVQFLDNEIIEGNGYRGPGNETPPRDSEMAILDHGNGMDLTRSCVIRRGVLHSNAKVVMSSANGIVEDCVIRNADTGLSVEARHADSIVLRGNRFENVTEPLDRIARQQAIMHPAERVLTLITSAENALDITPPADWTLEKKRLVRAISEHAATSTQADAIARAALLKALRSLTAATPAGHIYNMRIAEMLLGTSLRIQNWDSGMTRLLSSEKATEATVKFQAGIAPLAPPATCKLTFQNMLGWQLSDTVTTNLNPMKTTDINVKMRSAFGAKGFFRLPVTITYNGDGWTLRCKGNLTTLTENRLCQWVTAGPFTAPIQAFANAPRWQTLTNADAHGAMDLNRVLGPNSTGQTAIACAILRAARPTPVRFNTSGPIRLYLDNSRIGADVQRGTWGGVTLTSGDHLLKAATLPEKKDKWTFKVSCEIAETCLPGDLTCLPANEILNALSTLPNKP